MKIRPDELSPKIRYNLLIGSIVPRPIAVVGTRSPDGRDNLAPFSFFTAVSSDPPILAVAPANDEEGGEKDTLRNAKPRWEGGTGVFTVSVATEPLIRRVVAAAEPLPYGESEFALTGLTPVTGDAVAAPYVGESPVAYECETFEVLRFGPGRRSAGNLLLGRVVMIHLDDALQQDRMHIDPAKLEAIGRMGGLGYARTQDRFELAHGKGALDAGATR